MKGPLTRWAAPLLLAALALAALPAMAAGAVVKKEAGAAGERGWIGVELQDLDDDVAEAMDIEVDEGALITGVVDGSPADKAGLADGDVVVRFDGEPVRDTRDLRRLVRAAKPGDKSTMVIVSNGKEKNVTVIVGSAADAPKVARGLDRLLLRREDGGDEPEVWSRETDKLMRRYHAPRAYLGVSILDLSEQLGDYFGASGGKGALVEKVESDSPAEKAGLRAGDVIIAMDGQRIKSYEDVTEFLADADPGDTARVTVLRDRQETTFEVTLGEPEETRSFQLLRRGKQLPLQWHALPEGGGDVRVYKFKNGDALGLSTGELDELREEMKELQRELKELREEVRRESR